jgi:hypothetical protein
LSAPVDALPLEALAPLQPADAVQVDALLELQVRVELPPGATPEGFAVSATVGAGAGALADTVTTAVADAGLVPVAPLQVSV